MKTERSAVWAVVVVALLAFLPRAELRASDCSSIPEVSRSSLPPDWDCEKNAHIACLWRHLDDAVIAYRDLRSAAQIQSCDGARRGSGGLKSYDAMIRGFTSPLIADPYDRTPRAVFLDLILSSDPKRGFRAYQGSSTASEADAGIREALNEFMAGQLLVGNEDFVRGMRSRFPGAVSSETRSEEELLEDAAATFSAGLGQSLALLREMPGRLRCTDPTVLPKFPWFVRNARKEPNTPGEVVESELSRLTELAFRYGFASTALGRREFFRKGCAVPSGSPDLDCASAPRRGEALRTLKRAAQATYVTSGILAASQEPGEFRHTSGDELRGIIAEADVLYRDIQSGFNPLKLIGDFVPQDPDVTTLTSAFSRELESARTLEARFVADLQNYDVQQTAHKDALRILREGLKTDLEVLSGVARSRIDSTAPGGFNELSTPDSRRDFLATAESSRLRAGDNNIRSSFWDAQLELDRAIIGARLAHRQVAEIPELIRIEQERARKTATVKDFAGRQINAHQLAVDVASAFELDATGTPRVNPFRLHSALGAGREVRAAQLMLELEVDDIQSHAEVQRLLVGQAAAYLRAEAAGKEIEAAEGKLAQLRATLRRKIEDYVAARSDLDCAYFTNPAYRARLDNTQRAADAQFERAMRQGYLMAKAVEYYWAERFTNPITECLDDCEVGDGAIQKAESVFAVRSVGGPTQPSLDDFKFAVERWDRELRTRQLRSPNRTRACRTFKLRTEILRFGCTENALGQSVCDDELSRILFRDYVASNRVAGGGPQKDVVLPFSISFLNESVFPRTVRNARLDTLAINLVSRPGRHAAGGVSSEGFFANAVMLGQAELNTLRRNFDPPVRLVNLEGGRSLQDAPFRADLTARLDRLPQREFPSPQFKNFSPAVGRWLIWISMSPAVNRQLIPELLDDVEIDLCWFNGIPDPLFPTS